MPEASPPGRGSGDGTPMRGRPRLRHSPRRSTKAQLPAPGRVLSLSMRSLCTASGSAPDTIWCLLSRGRQNLMEISVDREMHKHRDKPGHENNPYAHNRRSCESSCRAH